MKLLLILLINAGNSRFYGWNGGFVFFTSLLLLGAICHLPKAKKEAAWLILVLELITTAVTFLLW